MAHVSLPESGLDELLSRYPDISAAACNSPRGAVISGEEQNIRKIVDILSRQQVFCKILNIAIPFHTPAIEPYKESLYDNIHDIKVMPMNIPVYSTLYGRLGTASDYDARYWADHIREPVQFNRAVEAMRRDGYTRFVEISPHAILTESVREIFDSAGTPDCTVIPTMERRENEKASLLNAVSRLICSGYSVNLEYFQTDEKASILRIAHQIGNRCRAGASLLFHTDRDKCRSRLVERVKSLLLEISDGTIVLPDDEQTSLFDAGMDSLSAFRLQKRLSAEFQISLPVTVVFEYPTAGKLADYLLPLIRENSPASGSPNSQEDT